MTHDEMFVRVGDDAQLCVETIGERGDPALLLIGGATWSKDWWDDELCERFADGGRLVVRYDFRDTGQSTSYPAGSPGYTGADQVSDAVAVLDGVGVERAHLVGLSMGGGIAQVLALTHPDRVASLTLISTTPVDPTISGLPGPTHEIAATFTGKAPTPDWTDRAAVIDHVIQANRPYAGPGTFDEPHVRAVAGRVFDRTRDMAATMTNHFLLSSDDQAPTELDRLGEVPTLVLHGTADPMFPIAHGRALAAAIPGAQFVPLEGGGHELPPSRTWDLVVEALLAHTR